MLLAFVQVNAILDCPDWRNLTPLMVALCQE